MTPSSVPLPAELYRNDRCPKVMYPVDLYTLYRVVTRLIKNPGLSMTTFKTLKTYFR